jgi:NADH dehydrogenase
VKKAFPAASILRPSIVIGHEDGFFNRFAGLAKLLPVLPLPGLETKFQPVYVGDVADAIVTCLDGGKAVEGKTFELGGPQVMTMREMLSFMMDHIDVHRPMLPLPIGIAKFQAFFLGLLPNPALTLDQVKMLQHDNVVTKSAKGLKTLKIAPTSIEAVLPKYCVHYRPQGQFTK